MKAVTAWMIALSTLFGVQSSSADGSKYRPTAEDLSVVLGMMWWIVSPPKGAEGIEFGIVSNGEFTAIAKDEFDSRAASGDIKVVYRDRGPEFDLASLSDGGSLFMPAQAKPSEFRKVLNPARRLDGGNTYEFVRFQSEDKKGWNRVLIGRFFGEALEQTDEKSPAQTDRQTPADARVSWPMFGLLNRWHESCHCDVKIFSSQVKARQIGPDNHR